MTQIITIGLDLAKHVLQLHGVDASGQVVVRRQVRRNQVIPFFAKLPPAVIGMEACGSAHHWGRELATLGHTVKLMPPAYVKPYVKRNKNDAADAEAICEAVLRSTMRFVPVKTAAQQASAMVYKARELLIRQRTQATNALRSHLAELGIVAAQGMGKVADLIAIVRDETDTRLPFEARLALAELARQIEAVEASVARLDEQVSTQVRANEVGGRLMSIPGIGPITAGALMALVPDPAGFRSARHFAAWLGFTPRQNSSGGKQRLGSISKQGNRCLRTLLILGAANQLRFGNRSESSPWLLGLRQRRPFKVVAVALAHKMARIVWALMVKGGVHRAANAAVATS